MPQAIGRKLKLSPVRRFFCGLLYPSREHPSVQIHRRMKLAAIAAARAAAVPCPSWRALFLKAFAHVSASNPLLRRCYLPLPWPHLYEHPETIAAIPVERNRNNENDSIIILCSETLPLSEIDAALESTVRSTAPPRRVALRLGMACSGRFRARLFGTFAMSAPAGMSAALTLAYGPVNESGETDVRLTYDCRVVDGFGASRALGEMEQVLHERMLTELRYIESVEAA